MESTVTVTDRPTVDNHLWFEILSHRERLKRLVRRRLLNPADVEDCVQETMLRVATYDRLDPERLGPLLTSVAMRLCVDQFRMAERNRRLAQRAAPSVESEGPEESVCDAEFGRWLLNQVSHLKGREKSVMLARIEGLSTAEFAQRQNISVKSAESAFTRARSRLSSISERELHHR